MCRTMRKSLGWPLAAFAAWGICTAAWAQQQQMPTSAAPQYVPAPQNAPATQYYPQAQQGGDQMSYDDIRARFDQQQRQIADLQEQLRKTQQGPQVTAVAEQGDATKKPADDAKKASEPYQVGSNLSGVVFFKDGEFLNFSTPNKDFTMHLGGWVQWDNVWWNQDQALRVAQTPKAGNQAGIASGNAGGGMNNGTYGGLEDGDYWRRFALSKKARFGKPGSTASIGPSKTTSSARLGSMKYGLEKTAFPWSAPSASGTSRTRSVWKAI